MSNKLKSSLKKIVPVQIRRGLRRQHQARVFKKAIMEFSNNIDNIENREDIISRLIYGWGNTAWSALEGYLLEVVVQVRDNATCVLECGSGLSTVLMGVISQHKEITVVSLEHQKSWGDRVMAQLSKFTRHKVRLEICSIKSYGDYEWYDITQVQNNKKYDLVICDGPPEKIKGGRYGLVPIMVDHFDNNVTILMDDYMRVSEKNIVSQWANNHKFSLTEKGSKDLYAILEFDK